MSLIIGMKCKAEGVSQSLIVASDTWASVGDLRFREIKIHQVGKLPVVIGGVGVTGLIKEIYSTSAEKLLDVFETEEFSVKVLRNIIPKIGDYIMNITKYFKDREQITEGFPTSQMVLAASDSSGDVALYSFDAFGVPNRCDFHPGYFIVGSGMVGGALLLNEFYPIEDVPDLDDAAELIGYIIAVVSSVDASVGGYPDFYILSNGEVKRLPGDVVENINALVKRRREILRDVWFELSKSEIALKPLKQNSEM